MYGSRYYSEISENASSWIWWNISYMTAAGLKKNQQQPKIWQPVYWLTDQKWKHSGDLSVKCFLWSGRSTRLFFFYSAFAFNKICGFFLFVQFFIFIRPWKKGLHPVKVNNFIVISFVFGFLTYVWMRLNARIFLEAGSRRPCWKYWAQERVVLEMFLMKYVSSYFIFFERNSQTIISD